MSRLARWMGFGVAVGLVLRGLHWWRDVALLECDGCEYARLAESLLASGRYEGLHGDGFQTLFPPLYALVIAGCTWLTGLDVAVSGRVVSLLAALLGGGGLTLWARARGGPRAALACVWLLALHPLFVLNSVAVFSEGLTLAWLAWLLMVLDQRGPWRWWDALAMGGLSAAAALTRSEALPLVLAWLFIAAFARRSEPRSGRLAILGLAVLGALLVPYAWAVLHETGQFSVVPKADRAMATVVRTAQGLPMGEAYFAVGPAGVPEGPWVARAEPWQGPPARKAFLNHLGPIARHLGQQLLRAGWLLLSGHTIGSIFLLAAAGLGALVLWRSGQRRSLALLVALLAFGLFHALIYRQALRYYSLFACGLLMLAALAGLLRSRPRWLLVALCALLAASASRGYVTGHREYDEAAPAQTFRLVAARELARLAAPHDLVASADARVAYYAGLDWVALPEARSLANLEAYFLRAKVRWLVQDLRTERERRGAWSGHHLTPPRAELVFEGTKLRILRLP